jgi:hypothetical protein
VSWWARCAEAETSGSVAEWAGGKGAVEQGQCGAERGRCEAMRWSEHGGCMGRAARCRRAGAIERVASRRGIELGQVRR